MVRNTQLPGCKLSMEPGSGAFERRDDSRCLTRRDASNASDWSLPSSFIPRGRPPLTYHGREDRWARAGDRAHLRAVGRGQEFVLDLSLYPEVGDWLVGLFAPRRQQ